MAARRLWELLQEQQEPFLLQGLPPERHCSPVEACGRRLRNLLCGGGYKITTACFTCGGGARLQRFRRLHRAGAADIGDVAGDLDSGGDALDCGNKQQLSPVSVLDLHSDHESTCHSAGDEEEEDGRTAGAAAKPCSSKARAVEAEGDDGKMPQRKSSSVVVVEKKIVSEWERIAADISRIPTLVALDLLLLSSGEWSRVAADEVGQSIEAIIFEELRWEAVRDIICLHDFLLL